MPKPFAKREVYSILFPLTKFASLMRQGSSLGRAFRGPFDTSGRTEDVWQGVMSELASPAGSCEGSPIPGPDDGGGWGAVSSGDDMDMSGASDCEMDAAAIVPVAGAPHVVDAVSADPFRT